MKNNLLFSTIAACATCLLLPVWLAAQGATPIAYGQSITDTINPATEIEKYTITAAAGDILWVRVSPIGSSVRPKVEVLTPQGLNFEMRSTNSFGTMVQIRKSIPANGGGTYTILVSDVSANYTGAFCISVERFNAPPINLQLNCDSSLSGNIQCRTSVRAFRYLVQQNAQSRIVVAPTGSSVRPHVWVCTANGTIVAHDSTTSFGQSVIINTTALQIGCVYVFVADMSGNYTGTFSISHALTFGECAAAGITADPPNATPCEGSTLSLTATTPFPNPSFAWSGPNNFSSTQQTITFSNVSNMDAGIYTVIVTDPIACSSTKSITITVKPTPAVNPTSDKTACGGTGLSVPFSGTAGATYNWTNSNTTIGLAASGTGNLNFTTANVTTTQIATIIVTPILNGCIGAPDDFLITVKPTPAMNLTANQTVCGGAVLNVNFVSTPLGASFAWSNSNTAIGLGTSGFGNIAFTAANVASQQTGTITVTPTLDGCAGAAQNFSVTVKPTPIMNGITDKTACGGTVLVVPFSSTPSATYNWTNSNMAIGLPASGTSNLNFTTASVTTTQTATLTVTPTLNGCIGSPINFQITVKPTPSMNPTPTNQTVCGGTLLNVNFASTPPGSSFNWTNSNTAIGLGASGSGDIAFTAANVAATGTVTVTPTLDGCAGAAQNFSITVKPTPIMNGITDKTACGGTALIVPFSSTPSATYNWTNSNTAIGLPASGAGSLNFTTANVATPQIATITVTPSLSGCVGSPTNFFIIVNPTPIMDLQTDKTVCGGTQLVVPFSSTPNSTYNWTNSNTAIGLAATGTGDLNFITADVITTQFAIIIVTPSSNGCVGSPVSFLITVNSTPIVVKPTDKTVCGGTGLAVQFFGTSGSTYSWTNSNTAIGLPASGTGNLNFTTANVTATQNAIITVTPSFNGCVGSPTNFQITVNQTPTMSGPADQTECGDKVINVNFSGTPGSSYSWSNSNIAIGLGASGTGNIAFITSNVTNQQTGTIIVTPTLAACTGLPAVFQITVNPKPIAVFSVSVDKATATFSGPSLNATDYSWNFGDDSTSTEQNPVHVYTVSGTYTVTLTAMNGCGTDAYTQQITVIVASSTNDPNWVETFRLFPNPTTGIVQVHTENPFSGKLEMALFDANGRQVRDFWMETPDFTLDMTSSPTGFYVLRVSDGESLGILRLAVIR